MILRIAIRKQFHDVHHVSADVLSSLDGQVKTYRRVHSFGSKDDVKFS
jgi:hypothetical protein